MPNHFHILATPLVENGIQHFMQRMSTGYSMYFNKKHNRTGVLFEGRFKSEHVGDDQYLKYLFSYIHLNPVKLLQTDWKEVGIADTSAAQAYLARYPYSSYQDYQKERAESCILKRESFPDYFQTRKEFSDELLSWLNYEKLPQE
jgi:putative transposase